MMWKGIAICGIWIGVGISAIAGEVVCMVAIFAMIATCIIALV